MMLLRFIGLILGLVLGLAACGAPAIDPQSRLDTAETHFRKGLELFDDGQTNQAARSFERARALDPDFPGVLVGGALVAMSQKDYWQARKDIARALHADGDFVEAHIALARVICAEGLERGYAANDWLEEAERPLKEAARRDPKNLRVAYFSGWIYTQAGELAKAQKAYLRVVEANRGPLVSRAMAQIKRLQTVERAAPGTRMGARIALSEQITRAEMVVLLLEELKLEELVQKRRLAGRADFSPPAAARADSVSPALPADTELSWARSWIETYLKIGVGGLEVFNDGQFYPDAPVQRINFALLNQAVLVLITQDSSLSRNYIGDISRFADVAADHYAFNAVVLNTERGLMAADPLNGAFRPTDPVSGAEALLVIRQMQNMARQEF